MARDYKGEIDALKERVEQLSAELEKRERQMVGEVESMADRSKQYWNEAYDAFQQEWDVTKDKAKDMGKRTEQYVKENPWRSVGIAAAAGFLAALLSNRRRD